MGIKDQGPEHPGWSHFGFERLTDFDNTHVFLIPKELQKWWDEVKRKKKKGLVSLVWGSLRGY